MNYSIRKYNLFQEKSGVYRETFRVHAEADRLRHPGRGHHHGVAAQQPEAAGKAHQGGRDRDLREAGAEEHEELGLQVPGLPLGPLHLQQRGHPGHPGAHLQERPESGKLGHPDQDRVSLIFRQIRIPLISLKTKMSDSP